MPWCVQIADNSTINGGRQNIRRVVFHILNENLGIGRFFTKFIPRLTMKNENQPNNSRDLLQQAESRENCMNLIITRWFHSHPTALTSLQRFHCHPRDLMSLQCYDSHPAALTSIQGFHNPTGLTFLQWFHSHPTDLTSIEGFHNPTSLTSP